MPGAGRPDGSGHRKIITCRRKSAMIKRWPPHIQRRLARTCELGGLDYQVERDSIEFCPY